ncbi:MAG: hypothetical protein K0S45_3704 [Nitrospira sp.]|nr:hypothetical protein [Nitrospira sp.]
MSTDILDYTQGFDFGVGVDESTGIPMGIAIKSGEPESVTQAGGQNVSYNYSIIESVEDFYDALDVDVQAKANTLVWSASAKFEFAQSLRVNTQSIYFVGSCTVANSFLQTLHPAMLPEAAALLSKGQAERFREAYGDSFVRGFQNGGQFYIVISISSSSREEALKVGAEVKAGVQVLVGSGSMSASVEKTVKQSSSTCEFSVAMLQSGGKGMEASLTPTIEEATVRLKQFPSIIAKNPIPYSCLVASYKTLPLPDAPNFMDFRQQKRVLNEAAKLVIRYDAALNDLEVVSKNIKSYAPFPISNLDKWRNTLETDIDAIYDAASHAVDNPKEAELPQVHSESVIASLKSLKRKAAPVRIVHFVGKPKPQRVRAQAMAVMMAQRRLLAQKAKQISAPAR